MQSQKSFSKPVITSKVQGDVMLPRDKIINYKENT